MKYLFTSILNEAFELNTTDIHLSIHDNTVKIEFRVMGNLIENRNLDIVEGTGLINYIKYMSHLDMDYQLSLNTGSFSFEVEEVKFRFRVSSIPTQEGDHLVIRLLDHIPFKKIEELTLDLHMQEKLEQICNEKQGLILFSGPTGVGKSTSMHVILNTIYQSRHPNIITIEDPIEMVVPEFTQIQISKSITYDKALIQILRHDPDIIMIGELRDSYSASLAIRCALTGCLVFATIHSKDSKSTLKRLSNLGVNEIELNEVLKVIISQKILYTSKYTTAIFEYYDLIENEFYSFEDSVNEINNRTN